MWLNRQGRCCIVGLQAALQQAHADAAQHVATLERQHKQELDTLAKEHAEERQALRHQMQLVVDHARERAGGEAGVQQIAARQACSIRYPASLTFGSIELQSW